MRKSSVMKNSQRTQICCIQPTGSAPHNYGVSVTLTIIKVQNLRMGIPEQSKIVNPHIGKGGNGIHRIRTFKIKTYHYGKRIGEYEKIRYLNK